MKFYEATTFEGRKALLSTQLDANPYKKLGTVATVEVPTDKEGLREYINALHTRIFELEQNSDPDPTGQLEAFASGVQGEVEVRAGKPDMSATAILRDMDEILKPKPRIAEKMFDPDDVQEIILNSRGFQLNNYFGACLEAAERVRKEAT